MQTQKIKPHVSVIIPVRNESKYINRCLESILDMEPIDAELEILIVDGMSEDGTRDLLEQWRRRCPVIKIFDNPQKHVPSALNIGIRHAKGEWIIRMDAHAEYPKNYLRLCLETSIRTNAENVGGKVIPRSLDFSRQGKLIQALTTNIFGVGSARFRLGGHAGWTDTVAFGCYRAEVFRRIGCFDERLQRNQDYEFNKRLRQAGGKIWFEPSIATTYYNRTTLRELRRQAFATGCWNIWTWTVAPYAFTWRHAIPCLFVLSLALNIILITVARSPGFQCLAVMGGVYFALASLASLLPIVKERSLLFICLPFLFFIYHIVYGLGELWGVILLIARKTPLRMMTKRASYRALNQKMFEPSAH